MKASEITEGTKLVCEDGDVVTVTEVGRGAGFRMGLEGHPDRPAIQLFHKKGWTLCHPDEDLEVAVLDMERRDDDD